MTAFVLPAGCSHSPERYDHAFVAMGSSLELSVVCDSEAAGRRAFQAARAEVERLESILSDFRPGSNVDRLNRRATDSLAAETRFLLGRAQEVCRATGGAFDVSLGPVKQLWGFGGDDTPHVPEPGALREKLLHVGCEVYALSADGRLEWRDGAARIDLGGIAQGYVAGCVADTLRGRGIGSFLVNVSGDIVVGGRRPDGGAWRVGVQHPRRADSLLARVPMRWTAVTTSGDYEQFFVADDGVRYHHVFDPATGYPTRGAASATVFSDDPVAADCYATALLVLGPERGLAFLDARPDLAGLFVIETAAGGVELRTSAALRELVPAGSAGLSSGE